MRDQVPGAKDIKNVYLGKDLQPKEIHKTIMQAFQYLNTKMKEEIADTCNINKKNTSHIARYTFAMSITLANGVPIETVSSMLGHNSIRTTQINAKVMLNGCNLNRNSIVTLIKNRTT